jgi:hypothetical protein
MVHSSKVIPGYRNLSTSLLSFYQVCIYVLVMNKKKIGKRQKDAKLAFFYLNLKC